MEGQKNWVKKHMNPVGGVFNVQWFDDQLCGMKEIRPLGSDSDEDTGNHWQK